MLWAALLALAFLFDAADSSAPCGGNIYVHYDTPFYSPYYPGNYSKSSRCYWTVTAPANSTITLTFTLFELESQTTCNYDTLEIYDGASSNERRIGYYCGFTLPPPIKSTRNKLYISFKTDDGVEKRGFLGFFKTGISRTYCNAAEHTCTEDHEKCISYNQLCDGQKDCPNGSDEEYCKSCSMAALAIPNGIYPNCSEQIDVRHSYIVNATCKKGYKLTEDGSLQCRNGSWSNVPKCVPSCSAPDQLPSNVQLLSSNTTQYLQGEHLFMKCSDGYFVSDSSVTSTLALTCKGNDFWEPEEFRCFPREHIRYVYKPHSKKIIAADVGGVLTLPCNLSEPLVAAKQRMRSFVWFKDSVAMKTRPKGHVIITDEGSLVFQDVSNENEGSYTCVEKEATQYTTPSTITYVVQVQNRCQHLPTNSTITAHQQTTVLMFCPYAGSGRTDPPAWFKPNGDPIFNDGKFNLISTFGLLIRDVSYADKGQYACKLGPNTPFCDQEFVTNLQVVPTSDDVCGLPNTRDEFPWLVTLWWDDEITPFCYGTLVNEQWVLTTAFCLIGLHRKRNPGVFVKFGLHENLLDHNGNSTTIPVEYAKIHPQYSRRVNMADIGVVKLKKPLTYREDVMPICLSGTDFQELPYYSSCESPPPFFGNVSGYGTLEADPVPPRAECMQLSSKITCPATPDGVFCAQGCDSSPKYVADTGAPFQVTQDGKMYLYGIFGWGERRVKVTDFDYFTAVFPYYKWISTYVNRRDP